MKKTFKSILCCLLSVVMITASLTLAFAEDTVTPVITVSDIEYNPLVSGEDVVFNYADFQFDLYFTSSFAKHITSIFTKENFEAYKNEDGSFDFLSMAMGVLEVTNITADVLDIVAVVTELYGNISQKIDFTNLAAVDFEQVKSLVKDAVDGAVAKYNETVTAFNALSLKKDGTVKNTSIGAGEYDCSLADIDDELSEKRISPVATGIAENIGEENTYVFLYDWRLSPIDNAEKLDAFVQTVKNDSGSDKVSIVSEGYGSTIAVTYLSEYEDNAKNDIKSFTTLSSGFMGSSLFGDIYTGKLIGVDSSTTITEKTSAVVRYLNDISDNPVTAFSIWLANYVLSRDTQNQDTMTVFQHYIEKVIDTFVYGLGKDVFANSLGLWALVPADSFDDAVDYMLGGEENADETLFASLKKFNAIQKNAKEILANAKNNGIFVNVVAEWDIQIFPLGVTSDVQSDGIFDTAYASFGAECVSINDVKTAMKAQQAEDTAHDHLSDTFDLMTADYSIAGLCHYIDASVCALPENTWFIQNMKNGSFNSESNTFDFLMWLIDSDTQRTVWDNGNYQQFIKLNRYVGIGGTLVTYAKEDIEGKYLLGDINLDGKITASDSALCDMIINDEVYYDEDSVALKNADINGDKVIDETDALMILNASSGLDKEMTSGFDYEKPEKNENLADAKGSYKTEFTYNPDTNEATVTLYLINGANETTGNVVINFDNSAFKLIDTKIEEIPDSVIVAGIPEIGSKCLTCGYKIKNNSEDELKLVTYTFELKGVISKDLDVSVYATEVTENSEKVNSSFAEATLKTEFFGILGDANGDHIFNVSDTRKLLRVIAKLDTLDENRLPFVDCDHNGKITITDARALLRISAKLDTFDKYFAENAAKKITVE